MRIELITIIVDGYDRAIEFFVEKLRFVLDEDSPALTSDGRPKRWVLVRPPGAETPILLPPADGRDQQAIVGKQVADRVGSSSMSTTSRVRERLAPARVEFVSSPRVEAYGRVVVFLAVSGNRWDLNGPSA